MLGFILKDIIEEGVRDGIVRADEALWGDKYSHENIGITAKVKTNEFRIVPTGVVKAGIYTDTDTPSPTLSNTVTQVKVIEKKFWYDVMYCTSRNRKTGETTTREISKTPLYTEILSEGWVVDMDKPTVSNESEKKI